MLADAEGRSGGRLVLRRVFCSLVVSVVGTGCLFAGWVDYSWAVVAICISGIICFWLPFGVRAFTPAFLLPLVFLHFFFVAPLLGIAGGESSFGGGLTSWFGWMALLNSIGLAILPLGLKFGRALADRKPPAPGELNVTRFQRVAIPLFLIAVALQVVVYVQFGGLGGYVDEFAHSPAAFAGYGPIFVLSESAPALGFLLFLAWARERRHRQYLWIIIIALAFFTLSKLLFGGLRGSRANTVWAVFWAAGAVHLWLRRLPAWILPVGAAGVVVFAYYYGFYKAGGLDSVESAMTEGHQVAAESSGRTFRFVLEGDMGRADVQAYLLQRLVEYRDEYELAMGRSYFGAMTLPVPASLLSSKPPTKVEFGTKALYGPYALSQGYRSSRQFGLAGEALLNFSVGAVPFAFFVYGILIGWMSSWTGRLTARDPRQMLVPLGAVLLVLILTSDSDNVVMFLLRQVPVACVVLAGMSFEVAGRRKSCRRVAEGS